jgi:hypothetical protein
MADLNQILQDMVNEDYDSLVNMAQQAISDLLPVFNEIAEDGNGNSAIIALFATALAVDGKLSDLEYKFVCDVIGGDFTYDEVKTLVQGHYSDDMIAAVDGLVDSCPSELKSKLLVLCCTFLAVDETINRDEVAFILKLIEE